MLTNNDNIWSAASTSTTSSAPTFEKLRSLMETLKKIPTPADALVVTEEEWARLSNAIPIKDGERRDAETWGSLYGMTVYVEPNKMAVLETSLRLMASGLKVIVVGLDGTLEERSLRQPFAMDCFLHDLT